MKVIEVSKEDLKYNLDIINNILKEKSPEKNVDIIAVVKANGIGLDLIQYSKFLIENGINKLAVATTEEAIKLREAGIKEEILLMSPTIEKEEIELLINNGITITIGSLEEKKILEEIASNIEHDVRIQIKIDTGFARYGFIFTEKEKILNCYNLPENIKVTGIFTHFSNPKDEKWTNLQFNRFMEVIDFLKQNNLEIGMKHCCSSTALLKYPSMYLDAVRIGSVIQGRVLDNSYGFKKIGVFKSSITEIKVLPKGYNISYSNTFKTKKVTKIAIVPVGYYDGFNKNRLRDDFSFKNNIIAVLMEIKKVFTDNRLRVKINNESYKVIGRLGMYHTIIDISNSSNISIGTEVILEIAPLQANEEIRRLYI